MLAKRMSREGERRTSLIAPDGGVGHAKEDEEVGKKPGFDRRISYKQEDMKRMLSERLMEDGKREGYESVGGGT